ncbi:MAG: hypothetical protein ABIJ05_05605 [Patescibacteria group bacterium]
MKEWETSPKKRCLVIEDDEFWKKSHIPFLVGNNCKVVSSYGLFEKPQVIINDIKENSIQVVIIGGSLGLTTVKNEYRNKIFEEIQKQIPSYVKTISFGSPFINGADVCLSKWDHDRLSVLIRDQ